jgi:hypothetical protein
MKKSYVFLLIVGLGLLGYLLWPVVVILFKAVFGLVIAAGIIAIIALIWYVASETSKHN